MSAMSAVSAWSREPMHFLSGPPGRNDACCEIEIEIGTAISSHYHRYNL